MAASHLSAGCAGRALPNCPTEWTACRGGGSGGSGSLRSSNLSGFSYFSVALFSNRFTFRVVGLIPARWHFFTQNGSWRNSCVATRTLGEETKSQLY